MVEIIYFIILSVQYIKLGIILPSLVFYLKEKISICFKDVGSAKI